MKTTIYQAPNKKKKQVQLTPRDRKVFYWIGEQYAVRRDHLQVLLSRESEWKFQIKGELVSDKAVKNVLSRWRCAGWVEVQKIFSAEPQWIWLTRKGIACANVPYPYRSPGLSKFNHYWHVNTVRLYLEKNKREMIHWMSERAINERQKDHRRGHMADGEAHYKNTCIGIEVELTQKSKKRLARILRTLKREYDVVWYFVADESYTALMTALKQIDRQGQVFVVYRLPDLLN
ncbi:MAG: hypothetical protein KJ069_16310 [Anaerolineae bacterium]|nr:hypothetical protein [Anaerolineae bacterium]